MKSTANLSVEITMSPKEARWLATAVRFGTPADSALRKRLPMIVNAASKIGKKNASLTLLFNSSKWTDWEELRDLVQTPFRDPQGPDDERMRKLFWDAVKDIRFRNYWSR